jgi:hypothetical protein
MATQTDEKMFDSRVVARHIKRDLVKSEDHQAYLDSLEDCSEMADECETVFSYRIETDEDEEAAAS